MRQMIKKKVDLANTALLSILCAMPSLCHAATADGIINGATHFLTGSFARGIGGLAVIGMGYLTWGTNKFPKESFMMVVLGSVMIFGGAEIYKRWVI